MSNIATSIEQSKHLLELGLSHDSADMVWTTANPDLPMLLAYPIEDCNSWNDKVPAWSLSALLEVIKGVFAYTTIAISGASKGFNFIRCKDLNYIWTHDVNADSPIDAAYEMVCWLLEQGLIKKGG